MREPSKNDYDSCTDEQLCELARQSRSIIDFCKKLGYRSTSSYGKFIKSRLQRLNVTIKQQTITKHSDEQVIAAANGARSVTEVMRNLGLAPHGHSHMLFKQRLEKLGIKIKPMAWRKGIKTGPLHDISFYLVKNSKISSSRLRKMLIRSHLKEDKCEICGLGPQWNNMPLTMHLDHVDGDRSNNVLSNLRITCPNCHSQTETYARIKRATPTGSTKLHQI